MLWNVSRGQGFPIELWKHPKIRIQVNQLEPEAVPKLQLDPEAIHILFCQWRKADWDTFHKSLLSLAIHPFLSLALLLPLETLSVDEKELPPKLVLLDTPLRQKEVRLILDRAIQAEFYKRAAVEIGNSCLENVGFFEGVFRLAETEVQESKKENEALRAILDYQGKVKKSQADINQALEKVNELKNQEIIELHERVKASEQLDSLRERELKEARELQKATEQVLSYSRIEEMNMEKLIHAHNKLLDYSESEIRALTKENEELKKKLGLSS